MFLIVHNICAENSDHKAEEDHKCEVMYQYVKFIESKYMSEEGFDPLSTVNNLVNFYKHRVFNVPDTIIDLTKEKDTYTVLKNQFDAETKAFTFTSRALKLGDEINTNMQLAKVSIIYDLYNS